MPELNVLLDELCNFKETIKALKKKLAQQRELTKHWINEFNELEQEKIRLFYILKAIESSELLKFDNFGQVDLERIKEKFNKEIKQ